jgi:hypothetical protein
MSDITFILLIICVAIPFKLIFIGWLVLRSVDKIAKKL